MRHAALLFSILVAAGPADAAPADAARPAVIAYVFPRDRVLDPAEIRAEKLTHVNFAFANVVGGRVVEGAPHDAENLKVLTGLRRDHPHLQILISVGGWTWSKGFSDAALTAKSRRVFVASAVDFVRRHDLDGFDVDWEYPGLPGDGNRHRPEDKENFTALMADLRAALDARGSPAGAAPPAHLRRGRVAGLPRAHRDGEGPALRGLRQPDDLRLPRGGGGGPRRSPREPLPEPRADPRQISADGAVRDFLAAGVPAPKLVLGVPFYGARGEGGAPRKGLYQRREGSPPADRHLARQPRRRSSVARGGCGSGTRRPRRPSSGTRRAELRHATRTRSRCASRAATCCEGPRRA